MNYEVASHDVLRSHERSSSVLQSGYTRGELEHSLQNMSFSHKCRTKTYANTASTSPSILMEGLAPSVASHSSVTNEPHIRIILLGEHCLSTMLTERRSQFGSFKA